MITEHTVLAYVSGSHVTGIEATTGAYLEDFTIDAFVEAHPPPGESGLWRWSGTVAITDDGDAEFAGEWSALWSPDQTCSVPPARITSGLRRRANDCRKLIAGLGNGRMIDRARLTGKAQAYEHAADIVEGEFRLGSEAAGGKPSDLADDLRQCAKDCRFKAKHISVGPALARMLGEAHGFEKAANIAESAISREKIRPAAEGEIILRVSREGGSIVVDADWPGTRASRSSEDVEEARFFARGLADRAISAVIREQEDPREKAEQALRLAGWEFRDGRWWRAGVWATARGGVIDIKATVGAAEAKAFASLAELPE